LCIPRHLSESDPLYNSKEMKEEYSRRCCTVCMCCIIEGAINNNIPTGLTLIHTFAQELNMTHGTGLYYIRIPHNICVCVLCIFDNQLIIATIQMSIH